MAARRAGSTALALALLIPAAQARTYGPVVTAQPTITGTVEAGGRLTAGSGTWTSATTAAFGYQFYQERQKTTGFEINVGERGISIEKK